MSQQWPGRNASLGFSNAPWMARRDLRRAEQTFGTCVQPSEESQARGQQGCSEGVCHHPAFSENIQLKTRPYTWTERRSVCLFLAFLQLIKLALPNCITEILIFLKLQIYIKIPIWNLLTESLVTLQSIHSNPC